MELVRSTLLWLYAPNRLGRALAITGAIVVAVNYGIIMITAESGANAAVMFFLALLGPLGPILILAGAVTGTINLLRGRKPSAATVENPTQVQRWAGRIIALTSVAIMFSPVAAASLLPPTPGNEGGAGSAMYLWGLLITVPVGVGGLVIAAIVGVLNMQRHTS